MNDMIEVKTADLIGLALDYATGIADGRELELPCTAIGRKYVAWCDPFVVKLEGHPDFHDKTRRKWEPSTDGGQCMDLIIKYRVNIGFCIDLRDSNRAYVWADMDRRRAHGYSQGHDQPLVAVCRAIVAAKLGETAQVPKELVQ